jgi:hypothetical protein
VFISFTSSGFLINEYSRHDLTGFTSLSIRESLDMEEGKSDRTYESNDQLLLQFVAAVFAKLIRN